MVRKRVPACKVFSTSVPCFDLTNTSKLVVAAIDWEILQPIQQQSNLTPDSYHTGTLLTCDQWTYLFFVGIFELGSLLCGVAQSSKMLIVGRAVAGLGGSGLMNGGLTILAACAPPEKRPALLGFMMGCKYTWLRLLIRTDEDSCTNGNTDWAIAWWSIDAVCQLEMV